MFLISGVEHNGWFREVPSCELPKYLCTFWSCRFQKKNYLSVEACLSPSLPFAVFALRLVGCDNVCCSSLVLSITAGSGRFPAVNSQSIYVPFGLVNSKKKKKRRFEEALAAAGGSGVGRPPVPAADLASIYHASWFDPSPPRQHVRQRVENRAAAVTQQRLVQ